jgi:hypothetical protein
MSVERLELPPFAFVVRCSEFQLSYTDRVRMAGFEPASACSQGKWATAAPHPEKWNRRDSNPQSPVCKTSAFPFGYDPKTSDRSGGDRTHDLRFVRPMLLPLSYAPKKVDWETWIRTTIDRVRICHPAG